MIRVYCDFCELEIGPRERGAHNKCSWCSRDICVKHIFIDAFQRPNCHLCAKEKNIKVRPTEDLPGSEQYVHLEWTRR